MKVVQNPHHLIISKIAYVLIMAWVFAMVDWQVIYLTRLAHPGWTDWMHNHERQYAMVKGTLEYILSTPSIPLKPIFDYAIKVSSTTEEQRKAITHAPDPSWRGFYRPIVRGQPYVFIPWSLWALRWLGPSLLWWIIISHFVCLKST